MTRPIAELPADEFLVLLPSRIFTDEEIADWIRNNRLLGATQLQLAQAISAYYNGGPVTGVVRTAIREVNGLPPVPGD